MDGLQSELTQFLKLDQKEGQEFEVWLERALEKAPEYPLITANMFNPSELDDEEYSIPELHPPFPSSNNNHSIPLHGNSSTNTQNTTLFSCEWLLQECAKISSPLSSNQIYDQIINILEESDQIRLESELLDLVGFDHMELISTLLFHRETILKTKQTSFTAVAGSNFIPISQPPGQQITVTTNMTRQGLKQLRQRQAEGIVPNDEQLNKSEGNGLEFAASNPLITSSSSSKQAPLPHVYVTPPPTMSTFSLSGKLALPLGTKHYDEPTHEEFILPYTAGYERDHQRMESIKPVKISSLDPLLRCAFQGYEALNRMQSAVFPMAHHSNENLLVCAPTGAGKTDVAMLTITKVIRDHVLSPPSSISSSSSGTSLKGNWSIAKDTFKIVYVAPMKALAAEITGKFARRLAPFGLGVREYTGDMQLTRHEVATTQMIVTTPEKWDVITRKSVGDEELVGRVKLLIIDEVHLLQEDRGPVIETIVARTLREMELSQRMIRIVGLSATLPNYGDVARFIRVDPMNGLFVFGEAFRPVPLTQHFVGIKGRNMATFQENLNLVTFEKCQRFLEHGHQVMIFVHARMETVKTTKRLLHMAQDAGCPHLFSSIQSEGKSASQQIAMEKAVNKSKSKDLQDLIKMGLAFHHAGMLRSDRSLVERLFGEGQIRVLCCTATLAWGVNLPAHAVIIKGTQVYDQTKGDFVSLGVLDVLQIFGRAGRPQYETHGEGLILTPYAELARYINSVLAQVPIESQFLSHLPDNLNAEIALGTVTNVDEAIAWLRDTYLYVRMRRNPLAYGITPIEAARDPSLYERLQKIVKDTAHRLRDAGMITWQQEGESPNQHLEMFRITEVGRIASAYYLGIETVEEFGRTLNPRLDEEAILAAVSSASEFKNLRVREEELQELDELYQSSPLRIRSDPTTFAGKAALLMIAHIARYELVTFSLVSDANYVGQNAPRIFRAVFEITRTQGWLNTARRALTMAKSYELQVWPQKQHPLWQFVPHRLKPEIMIQVEQIGMEPRNHATSYTESMEMLRQINKDELERRLGHPRAAPVIQKLVNCFPRASLNLILRPITDKLFHVQGTIEADYIINEEVLESKSDRWWVFLADSTSSKLVFQEEIEFTKLIKERTMSIYLPIGELGLTASTLAVYVISDRWLHAENSVNLSLAGLKLPLTSKGQFTNVTIGSNLSISCLEHPILEAIYTQQHHINHLNPLQSQLFSVVYQQGKSLIVAASPGNGIAMIAELAIWRLVLNAHNSTEMNPTQKQPLIVLYITSKLPQRLKEWKDGWAGPMDLQIDEAPTSFSADRPLIIFTSVEGWKKLNQMKESLWQYIALFIVEDIHYIGSGDKTAAILEIVITQVLQRIPPSTRLLFLSGSSLANANDLSTWIRRPDIEVYNFYPSVRPISLEVQIEGFAGRTFAQRLAAMNRPLYRTIIQSLPLKSTLIYVSSPRQARLTALALISYMMHDGNSHCFSRLKEVELQEIMDRIKSVTLRHTSSFGIALYHARLSPNDRKMSLNLFMSEKTPIMIACTDNQLIVPLSAHTIIIKGTERYDGIQNEFTSYPITQIMKMLEGAGRSSIDTNARVVLLTRQNNKFYYRHFLSEPFSLESFAASSDIKDYWADYLNQEIVAMRIKNRKDALNWMKKTFLAVRIDINPSFYGLHEELGDEGSGEICGKVHENGQIIQDKFLSNIVLCSSRLLLESTCLEERDGIYCATTLGRLAAHHQCSHQTIKTFVELLGEDDPLIGTLLQTLSLAQEFIDYVASARNLREIELLHDLEKLSTRQCPVQSQMSWLNRVSMPGGGGRNSVYSKVVIILMAHLAGVTPSSPLLCSDMKIIIELAHRLTRVLAEVARHKGYLATFIRCIWLIQALDTGKLFSSLDPPRNYSPSDAERYRWRIVLDKSTRRVQAIPMGNDVAGTWHLIIGCKTENRIVASSNCLIDDNNPPISVVLSMPKELDLGLLTVFLFSENRQGIDQEYALINL